ncbi:F-box protein SKIP23-like [Durio zibethinus]|uniref:F-box protein SKIP23-like n=1 Tax=Durio zibethinus TaxID=66656 RepID=A0A6P5YL71_DURZI|nr:F-box protein SKIP23-like [Durio zibethinus]XP_022741031.1 F-box protein SKIP23-like [Durio zibethinus]
MDRVSWSNLPEDLLVKIGKYLDALFDVIRFRSVCRRWRYSLSFLHINSHLEFPGMTDRNPQTSFAGYVSKSSYLVKNTVYILNQYATPSPISMPWLLKLEETEEGKLRIINPMSNSPVKDLPSTFPNVLNLLDFPILEVSRGYIRKDTFKRVEHATSIVTKAVMLPESGRVSIHDDFMVLNLCQDGGLILWRNGDDELKQINEHEFHYDDIAVYKGRFVAVDRWGTVSLVDSSSQLIKYTPPIFNGGSKKHLVVTSEDLYAVDRYLDRARTTRNPYKKEDAKVVAFKVYKLDEEWGWTEVTSLDNRILFIGEGLNFFVPIGELRGCNGNCIYFVDEDRTWYNDDDDALVGSTGHGIAVFNLVNGRIGKLSSFPGYSEMFWPPPSWFTAN